MSDLRVVLAEDEVVAEPDRPPLARSHEAAELPAEEPPVPPWIDLWRVPNLEVGERGFDRFNNDRLAASNAVGAAVVGVFALSVVAWFTVEHVLPWLLPWLADNRRPVLCSSRPWPWRWGSTSSTGPGMWSCSAKG